MEDSAKNASLGRTQCLLLILISVLAVAAADRASAEVLLLPESGGKAIAVGRMPAWRPSPEWNPIRPPTPSDLPFRVTQSRVDIRIEENVAATSIEQSFLNLTSRDLEVRVLIPLPRGSAINKSALSMNDELVEGRLYDAHQAQSIYESIVSQRRDPALLRFVGDNLYEARIFPIPPNQQRRLKFSYDQVLNPVEGLYDFRHILSGSQLYPSGLEKFSFECLIRGQSNLGPVYSPSHTVEVKRPDPKTAIVKLSGSNLATDRDFQLFYAPSAQEVTFRLVTHRPESGEDGYFMLVGRPDDQLDKSKILPKEIVFVLDCSGSMAGEKIQQARQALAFCVNQLNAEDRFNLVTFSTDVRALSDGKLLQASPENVKKALQAVETIEATGGTDIDGALRVALSNDFSEGAVRAKLVVFLTDGLPSVGITDINEILKDVREFNQKAKVRLFNFGVGTDVNTHLLDRIATDYDGTSSYVAPKENLELKVSDFYAKIKNPVMTDLTFDLGGVQAHSFYPRKVPALFKGNEILLFGRYKGLGPGKVALKGNVAGEPRQITLDVQWAAQERGNAFLPRVWAMRKIGHLLEEIRLRGSNQETINEIVQLSHQHGIVTPYTSQLVLEPGMQPGPLAEAQGGGGRWRGAADREGRMDEMKKALGERLEEERKAPGAPAPDSAARAFEAAKTAAPAMTAELARDASRVQHGGMAVGLAEAEKKLKEANNGDDGSVSSGLTGKKEDKDQAAARRLRSQAYLVGGKGLEGPAGTAGGRSGGQGGEGAEAAGEEMADLLAVAQELTVKHIGNRTFYLRQGTWIDSSYKPVQGQEPTRLEAYSKPYFELLAKHPQLGPVLALNGRILVVVEGKAYQITTATDEANGGAKPGAKAD